MLEEYMIQKVLRLRMYLPCRFMPYKVCSYIDSREKKNKISTSIITTSIVFILQILQQALKKCKKSVRSK